MLSREEALARAETLWAQLDHEGFSPASLADAARGMELVADALLAAQAEARSRFLGAPLTAEALGDIREWYAPEDCARNNVHAARADILYLLSHVDHLEGLLGDLRGDGALDPYLKGRQAGRAEGRAECLRALEARRDALRAEAAKLDEGLWTRDAVEGHAERVQECIDALSDPQEGPPRE
jgi:hypothetical protein